MKVVVIFAQIRPAITERLSIAMLAFNNDSTHFRYSNTKVSTLKHLLPQHVVNYIKSYLFSVDSTMDNLKGIFESEAQTFLYKQIYNNLVCFECFDIEIDYSIENIDKLFKKYVG